jgi:hypothetical protein
MPHPRCSCILGRNPYCPVDHDAEEARNAEVRERHAARLLADVEWIAERMDQVLPYRPESTGLRDADTSNAPHLLALASGTAEQRMAAANAIGEALRQLALSETEWSADEEIKALDSRMRRAA